MADRVREAIEFCALVENDERITHVQRAEVLRVVNHLRNALAAPPTQPVARWIVVDKDGGESDGFAYTSEDDAGEAAADLNRMDLGRGPHRVVALYPAPGRAVAWMVVTQGGQRVPMADSLTDNYERAENLRDICDSTYERDAPHTVRPLGEIPSAGD